MRRRVPFTNSSTNPEDILVHAGPGAGKTIGALLGFKKLKEEGHLNKFIILCHRNSIASQWREASLKLQLEVGNFEEIPMNEIANSENDGWIVTYQGATRSLELHKEKLNKISNKRLLAIADEAHHLGVNPEEPDEQIWGKVFLELTSSSTLRVGLTGTPFRADNLGFCSARKIQLHVNGELIEQIRPDLCVEPRELISVGDIRPLEFHFQDGWVEHNQQDQPNTEKSSISSETRETWRARNLRRAIKLSDKSSIGLQLLLRARKKLEQVRTSHDKAAGLVIAKDIEHAKIIAEVLKENGDSVELVHSLNKEANIRLKEFQKKDSKWLVSVDMCSEGFDAPRLRVLAYMTTVVTRSRFIQGITRIVRVNEERTSIESIPRDLSYVFAPADPLLLEYARNWSSEKPYLIKGNAHISNTENLFYNPGRITLPMQAISDGAGEIIKMRSLELPRIKA